MWFLPRAERKSYFPFMFIYFFLYAIDIFNTLVSTAPQAGREATLRVTRQERRGGGRAAATLQATCEAAVLPDDVLALEGSYRECLLGWLAVVRGKAVSPWRAVSSATAQG